MHPVLLWGVLAFCVLGISAGQMLFKLAADRSAPGLIGLVTSPLLLAAVALYGVVTVAWVTSLRHIDLSRAYVFMALTYLLVPLAASRLFGEDLSVRYWVGAGLIMAGIVITGRA